MKEFNEFQTPLTESLIKSLPKEVVDEFWEYVNTVPFIQRLISPDRKRAKDLPRDEEGKIIVDLSNPHILEDMDYFRETAIHYQKYKCFTKLRVNTHPQSEYMRWFKREIWRIWHGMVRPSDGEWITGDMYFYLNYFPIIQTKIIKKGKARYGERTVDLPEVWEGVYWRFHYWEQAKKGGLYNNFEGNQHAVEIARRGASKSYCVGSKIVKNFVLGIDEHTNTKVKSLIAAYNKEYLVKDGTLNKVIDGINFLANNTQFPSRKIKNSLSEMQWIAGWIDEDNLPKGSENEILGISISDDPDKIRGKRSNYVFFEEYAVFPKFLDTWQVALPNVQEGSIAFGQNIGIATGGSEGADFMGALEMIQYPRGYNVYALPNVYDKNSSGKRDTLFFFPGYINVKGFYNKDGVSDVVGAMIEELKFRYNLKYNSSDPIQLSRRKAETAFTIQDAIMKTDSTIYPVADLNDQINWLDNNPAETQKLYVGKLVLRDGEVEWKPDPEAQPINHFPHKDNKLRGAVVIKEHPIKGSDGKVPWGRYISGADTIDTDGAETLSLFSCYVLDLWTDEIVAEYTGREELTDDSFEIYRLLLMYYNAEGNYENNKKGLFSHFSKFNSLHLLADTLEFLREKDPQRQRIGNATKGTPSSVPIKNMGRRMIRDFLLKPYDDIKIEVVDGVETEVKTTERSLKKIRFRALLQELATYNTDGNFDRHDALLMLMLIREDKLRLLGDDSWENRYERDKDYLGDDPFFNSNYKGKDDNKQFLETMKRLGISV